MLLFCDSFDHYNTATLGEKYLNVDPSNATIVTGGRVGNCLELIHGAAVTKNAPDSAQLIVGFALNPSALPSSTGMAIIDFIDSGSSYTTPQGELRVNAAGGIEYHTYPSGPGSDTLIASSPNGIVLPNTYQIIEVSVLFATTATGTVAAQVNGESVFSVTGVVTSSSGNNYANVVSLTNGAFNGAAYSFDDYYICDGTGTINNSFLGDVGIQCLFPNGEGQSDQFTPNGPSINWECVSETTPPGDAAYVSAGTVGYLDLYTIQPISGSPSAVVAVQVVASARKDDSVTRVLGLAFGNGTTWVVNSGSSLGSNYKMYTQPYDSNPITSSDWTVTAVDNGQIGVSVTM